jgi:glutathione S-transferase
MTVRTLYHYPLCGFSRVVRFILSEKKLDYSCVYQSPWDIKEEVLEYNVAGTLPVFVDINGTSVFGSSAIREFIEEVYPEPSLIGEDPTDRAEARRISDWFDYIFYNDVYSHIVSEKINKRFMRDGNKIPDPSRVRLALSKLHVHLDYVSWLGDRRNWLAGQYFSIADIYAASFLSVVDYLGCIPWHKHDVAKQWYARIKSRPAFRKILGDNLSQIPPSPDYSNPDF